MTVILRETTSSFLFSQHGSRPPGAGGHAHVIDTKSILGRHPRHGLGRTGKDATSSLMASTFVRLEGTATPSALEGR